MGEVVPFRQPETDRDDTEAPSPAMRRLLLSAAEHPTGRALYAPVRTIRACLWRGWCHCKEVGRDEGEIGGLRYSHPIYEYYITGAGYDALSRT